MKYKGYLIAPVKGVGAAYSIATEGRGGKIPNMMLGMFTSMGSAMQVIDFYLNSKESAIKNDKEIGKG